MLHKSTSNSVIPKNHRCRFVTNASRSFACVHVARSNPNAPSPGHERPVRAWLVPFDLEFYDLTRFRIMSNEKIGKFAVIPNRVDRCFWLPNDARVDFPKSRHSISMTTTLGKHDRPRLALGAGRQIGRGTAGAMTTHS